MWILLVVLYSCICLSRENICTQMSRFPHLSTSYAVVGQPIETIGVGGLLGCVKECQLKATCEAFTYSNKTRDCNMYDQFMYSSSNNINANDVITSIISDWNIVEDYRRVGLSPSLQSGQDCFIPATEQLFPNGTVIKRGRFYNGTLNVTLSGRECQKWISHTPHKHDVYGSSPDHFATGESMEEVANYCRIILPDTVDIPWCYTIDPTKRWEKCNVTECE
ncbi:uncharacterized protein [Haliotis asinina]|uniref:uncharacterized protein n=1 Tax=Haliotis asinina TaxID=109174 RepID=UPI00353246C7